MGMGQTFTALPTLTFKSSAAILPPVTDTSTRPASTSLPPPPPPPQTQTMAQTTSRAPTPPPSGDFVPATMPRTGIMFVKKSGRSYVLLTSSAKTAKKNALRALGTSSGNSIANMIQSKTMSMADARSYAGQHYSKFYGGALLTQAEYDRVQSALGANAVALKSGSSMIAIGVAFQEAQDAAAQANEISDQADQRVTDLQNELDAWKTEYEELLASIQAGSANTGEIEALLAQVNALTAQLDEAKRVADEASADAEAAEEEAEAVEEIAPWYVRYKWHIGVGALVVVAAGGVYWLTSRRPVERNTRLPAPTSPKHPAGF